MDTEILAVAKHAGLTELELRRPLGQSPTHGRWLVNSATGLLVISIARDLAIQLQLDSKLQYQLLDQLKPAGIAPEPVVFDEESGILVVRFVPGEPLDERPSIGKTELTAAANLLRKLHAADIAGLPSTLHMKDKIGVYAKLVGTASAAALAEEAAAILELRNAADATALCHNDVHPGNLICGESLRLIDWDYAALGDPYFDIAGFVASELLCSAQKEYFLNAYFGANLDCDHKRLEANHRLNEIVRQLWECCVAMQ